MTVGDIFEYINSFAPFCSAESWDNPGLIIGDKKDDVKKVLLCLDVTDREAELAKANGAGLIISHHPLIFQPLRSIAKDSVCYKLIKYGINVISAHTNLDKAPSGVNDALCSVLGEPFYKAGENTAGGFLNIITPSKTRTAEEYALFVKSKLGAAVRYCDAGSVSVIGVCSGAGADFINEAKACGCDAYLTGDASYHDFLNASDIGISLFAAGHFETENMTVHSLYERLSAAFPDIEFVESDRQCPVLTVV